MSKGNFLFATAARVPALMEQFERDVLARHTPCNFNEREEVVRALAETHVELVLIHPSVAMRNAVNILSDHPLIGRRVEGEIRELVISYGKTGYIALYRFLPEQNLIRRLAIRHQHELDFPG